MSVKSSTFQRWLRAGGLLVGISVLGACGNIVTPGDNTGSGGQPTVVVSEPAQPSVGPEPTAAAAPVFQELPAGIEKVTTPSGLQYADTVIGTGAEAKAGPVSMYYTGYLTDGTIFDSNTSGPGFQFNLGGSEVIQGWDLGIVGMKEGGKRRLFIPAALGYGAQGTPGGPIPPNADLIFDVELVKVGQ
jgi:FKBP-type peptidyl-prolyl cis-trans isomerase FkpA